MSRVTEAGMDEGAQEEIQRTEQRAVVEREVRSGASCVGLAPSRSWTAWQRFRSTRVTAIAGSGEAVVSDERAPLSPGTFALIPELVPHDVYATGEEPLKAVGFFSTAVLESIFDEPMEPFGVRVLGTPPIEAVA